MHRKIAITSQKPFTYDYRLLWEELSADNAYNNNSLYSICIAL
jgi:hypothetical protein